MKTMTKSELIARLAERNPRLVARDADEAVNTMLDAMTDALENERAKGTTDPLKQRDAMLDLFTQRMGTETLDQLTHTPHRLDALLFSRKPGIQR